MPSCKECGESLRSHAGRGHKYFHGHVLDGPYLSGELHHCSLVDCAFEADGSPVPGSGEARLALANSIHGHKVEGGIKSTPIGQAYDEHGNTLAEAFGNTKREVFDKLMEQAPDASEDRIKYLEGEIERLQNRELEEGKSLLDKIARTQIRQMTAEWRQNKEQERAMTDHVFPEQPQPT